jgi:hypothetical protein
VITLLLSHHRKFIFGKVSEAEADKWMALLAPGYIKFKKKKKSSKKGASVNSVRSLFPFLSSRGEWEKRKGREGQDRGRAGERKGRREEGQELILMFLEPCTRMKKQTRHKQPKRRTAMNTTFMIKRSVCPVCRKNHDFLREKSN